MLALIIAVIHCHLSYCRIAKYEVGNFANYNNQHNLEVSTGEKLLSAVWYRNVMPGNFYFCCFQTTVINGKLNREERPTLSGEAEPL